MSHKKVMKLATEGKRLGAYCIDAVIPLISSVIIIVALSIMSYSSRLVFNNGFGYGYGYGYNYGFGRQTSGGLIAALLIAFLIMIAYLVVQIVFFTKSKTLGKAALGLQVVSSDTGEPISFWKMLFREWFVKKASSHVFMIGYIWVIVDDKNRGWHDKILDTYVVDLKESAALSARRSGSAPADRTAPSSRPVSAPAAAPAARPASPASETNAPAQLPVSPAIETAASAAKTVPAATSSPEIPAAAPAQEAEASEAPETVITAEFSPAKQPVSDTEPEPKVLAAPAEKNSLPLTEKPLQLSADTETEYDSPAVTDDVVQPQDDLDQSPREDTCPADSEEPETEITAE